MGAALLRVGLGSLALVAGCDGGSPPKASRDAPPAPPPLAQAVEGRWLTLSPGVITEATLAAGERHVYRFELSEGLFANLVVDQRGVDVMVSLYDAGGRRLRQVDSPNDVEGPERLPLVAESTGALVLEVSSSGGPPGRYAVLVDELRPANARDRNRIDAERVFAEANELRWQGTRPSRRAAVARYAEALETFRAFDESGRAADVLERLALTYNQLGETARAVEAYQEALPIFRDSDRKLESGNALNGLGLAYWSLGEMEKAIETCREALEIHRSIGRRRSEATSLVTLGRAFDSLGKAEPALRFTEQALSIYEDLDDRIGGGRALSNLGLFYSKLGKRRQAREILERAFSYLEAEGQIEDAAIVLHHLGRDFGESNQPEKEVEYLLRALPMLRQDRREEAVVLNNLGWAYQRLQRADEARDAHARALDIFRELGDRRSEAAALINLGRLRTQRGELAAARELYERARELSAATADPQIEAEAFLGLARCHRDQDRLAEAQAATERALERIEALRTEPGSPGMRSAFLATKQEHYSFYVDLLMTRHRREPAAGYDVRALEASEQARARSLLDLMAEAGVDLRRGIDPELLARETELARRLNAADRRRLSLLEEGAPPERLERSERELRRLLTAYERLEAEIRLASPRSLTRGAPASLREIRQALDDDSVLLEYALGKEKSYAWAVTRDSVESFPLAPREVLEGAARRVHALLAVSNQTLARGEAEIVLAELSELLLEPIAEKLAGRRLLVAADGALHFIPFAALPMPGGTGSPLVAEHEVVNLPSASTLVELRRETGRRSPSKAVAVIADPVFDVTDPRVASRIQERPVQARERAVSRTAASGSERFQRLPYSRAEAEAILDLVPVAEKRLAALGFEASRKVLGELGDYRILHFATHGLFDPEHPELSRLALSLADEHGRRRDGFLRAHEIYRMDLTADLVVLSACQTALGKMVRGEGLLGLTRAFMVAGAGQVVVSLWQVEDHATAELMRHFYREMLIDGSEPAAALRQAQVAVRRQKSWEAPFYWAAFALHGDGRKNKPAR